MVKKAILLLRNGKIYKSNANSFPSPYRGEKYSLSEVILIHKYQSC